MPVRAEPLQLPTDATLDDAVETVIASALGQFVANRPAMEETHHRESIRISLTASVAENMKAARGDYRSPASVFRVGLLSAPSLA